MEEEEEKNTEKIDIPLQNEFSGNLISTIYKGYFVNSSIKVKLDINQQFENNEQNQMEIESQKQQLQECLVINKPNTLEVFTLVNGITEPCFEINLFANIKSIQKIPNPSPQNPDYIFLLTEDLQYNIFQISKNGTQSFYQGSLFFQSLEQKSEDLIQVCVQTQYSDSDQKGYILVYAYMELLIGISFKFNNQQELKCKKPCNIKIHQPELYNIVPLHDSVNQIAILYNEVLSDYSCMQIYDFDSQNDSEAKPSKKMHWFLQTQESITGLILLENNTGGLIFTCGGISFYNYGDEKYTKNVIFNGIYKCHIQLQAQENDRQMYIVGSENASTGNGELYLLFYYNEQKNFEIKYLGDCSSLETITNLGNNFLFIGSENDDCQLLQILSEPLSNFQHIKIWATFANLGLIYSMQHLKNETSQQFLLSTPRKSQSLNIFQKSISLNKLRKFQFTIPIKQIFNINNNIILISFKNSTLLLNLQDKFFVNSDSSKYMSKQQTLHVINNPQSQNFIQVTRKGIYIIDFQQGIINQVEFQDEITYQHVTDMQNIIYATTDTNKLLIYQIQNNEIKLANEIQLQRQSSSIAVSQNALAISFWFDNTIQFYNTQNFQTCNLTIDKQNQHINSLIFHKNKLLIGFGNGNVQIYHLKFEFSENFLIKTEQIKEINVGNKPVNLKAFNYQQSYFYEEHSSNFNINCISSEASILKCLEDKNERFEKISINSNKIQLMEEIIINKIPHLLTVSNNNTLEIGTLETSQKYHISSYGKNIQKKPQPQQQQQLQQQQQDKIQNQEIFKSEIVSITQNQQAVISLNIFEDPINEVTKSRITINDQASQELIDAVEIAGQRIYDILNIQNLIIAGGEILDEPENEMQQENTENNEENKGTLHILKISKECKVQKYVKIQLKCSVISIHQLNNDHIIVVSGQQLIVYKIIDLNQLTGNIDNTEFIEEIFRYDSGILINQVDVNEIGYIMIADPIKNINVFKISIEEKSFQPICRATCLSQTFQAKFFGNAIVQGDYEGNIIILEKDIHVKSDLERLQLKITDSIGIGDQITTSCKNIVDTRDLHDTILQNQKLQQIFFATKKGTLGTIINLDDNVYKLLSEVQRILLEQQKPELGFKYQDWKKINTNKLVKQDCNFVNYEIIRKLQDFKNEEVQQVIENMEIKDKPNVHDLVLLIDNLDQLNF